MASREEAVRGGREKHQLAIYDVEANDENEAEMKEAKRFAKVDPQDPWATVAEVMGIDPKRSSTCGSLIPLRKLRKS